MITTEQKILAILCHLGYLVGGISLILVPLIIFFWKKEDYFIADHAKQALVAQTVVAALSVVAFLFTFLIIGILLWPLLLIICIIFLVTSFIAAYKAFNGEYYQYPFTKEIINRF